MRPYHLPLAALALIAGFPLAAQGTSPAAPDAKQIAAATRYALPHLLTGYRATCANSLSGNGYIGTQGDRLQVKFAQGSEAYWPQAKTVLIQMAAKKGGEDASALDVFANLPDESLKPFVDGIIASIVSSELKPADCGEVERGLALLDPLPAENVAGLIGFIFEMVEKGDAQKDKPARATRP